MRKLWMPLVCLALLTGCGLHIGTPLPPEEAESPPSSEESAAPEESVPETPPEVRPSEEDTAGDNPVTPEIHEPDPDSTHGEEPVSKEAGAQGVQPSPDEQEVPADPPVPPEDTAPPEATPEELLDSLLSKAGYTQEELTCDQLLVVQSDGNCATLWSFARGEDQSWTTGLSGIDGHVGKNGVTSEKTEGDKKSPVGLFPLLTGFGIEPPPEGCIWPYRPVTENSYWVDDPSSSLYNQWTEEVEGRDWSSAEHLIDYKNAYALGLVVGYNTDPPISGKGSAIFVHCGSRPTAGCVSMAREHMVELLTWLDPHGSPAILIF